MFDYIVFSTIVFGLFDSEKKESCSLRHYVPRDEAETVSPIIRMRKWRLSLGKGLAYSNWEQKARSGIQAD